MPKEIKVSDYDLVAPDFFDKYNYVAERLPEGTRAEDVIKIMQQLGALVLKRRAENKAAPFGFNKVESSENEQTEKEDV